MESQSGFASINGAQIYYEVAGTGQPFVMLHAGVSDSRQWNNEFAYFAQEYTVIRYDARGFGKSKPVEGEFSNLEDLKALLDHLQISDSLILMGCSMGGGLSMDFALENPSRAKALIMVGSGPGGLELDIPSPKKFAEAEKAYEKKDWDLLVELYTQIWFDGINRTAEQVDPTMRKLVYEMNRTSLMHHATGLGEQRPNIEPPAATRLQELTVPILVVVGEEDVPYIRAAADHMVEKIPSARKVVMQDAAHLPNMEHPEKFQQIVSEFLAELSE